MPTCPNHPTVEMEKQPEFYALTTVKKNGNNISFLPATGIPVTVYFCRVCGKIELFGAISDQRWRDS